MPELPGQEGAAPADPDDPIERRKREIEKEIAAHDFVARAAFREPSAKERARKPGWVSRRRAAARARKAQRRASKRPSRLRQHGRGVVTALVIAIVVAGLAFVRFHGYPARDRTPVPHGPVPSVPAFPAVSPATSITRPFAGSPAAAYADGAAGIVLPAARPVGRYPAASVAAAYATVRKLLIAAYLDPETLRGGSPDAFARMLIPEQRTWFIHNLNKLGADAHGAPRSSRSYVVSFAPGTQIVGSVIKVHGTMWARQATENGQRVLRIRTSYVFVYPVERPGEPATLIRIVPHNYGAVDFATWDDPAGALEPWLYAWGGGAAGGRCDVMDGFVHPQFANGPPETVAPSGPPVDPYSLASPSSRYKCQQTTGT